MTLPEKPVTEELEVKQEKKFIKGVENFFFILACTIMSLYAVAETLHKIGWKIGPCGNDVGGIPVGILIMCGFMILPKIAGRASAGRIYEGIANRFGGK